MRNIKSRSAIVCLLLCALVFSACSSNTSTPKVKHSDCALWHVKLKDVNPEYVEDYEYLWDLLENEYPMLNAAERITDKKAEAVRQQYYYYDQAYFRPTCKAQPTQLYQSYRRACR